MKARRQEHRHWQKRHGDRSIVTGKISLAADIKKTKRASSPAERALHLPLSSSTTHQHTKFIRFTSWCGLKPVPCVKGSYLRLDLKGPAPFLTQAEHEKSKRQHLVIFLAVAENQTPYNCQKFRKKTERTSAYLVPTRQTTCVK